MTPDKCKICGGGLVPFLDNMFDDRHGYPGSFEIKRCPDCGFGQTVPEIPEAEISEIYTDYYPRKNVKQEDIKKEPPKLMSSA